jgi:hypothetical protein
LASVPSDDLYLSVLVVGEIRRDVERLRRRDPAQAGVFEIWLDELQRHFAEHVLPIDLETAEEWGRIGVGGPVPGGGRAHGSHGEGVDMVFVTRNTAHVARTGVRLHNPWD